jgi:hypothetical protein
MKCSFTEFILACLDASLGGRSRFPELLAVCGAARDPARAQLALPFQPSKDSAARA